ncbi:MAG: hypothetical protein AAGF12_37760 [Myxococcota bacterium]
MPWWFVRAWMTPQTAYAAGGGESGAVSEIVLLLALVAVAYLLTHFVVGRLQRWFLIVAGLEYVVLGALLGPGVPVVKAFDDLTKLLPVIALATGWIGLLRGMELRRDILSSAPRGTLRIALFDVIFAGGLVTAASYFLAMSGFLGPITASEASILAGVLGCCAATRTTEPLDIIERRYRVEGPTVPLLRQSARVGDALSIFVFGLLFCIFRPHEGASYDLSAAGWIGVSTGLGVLLGLLFRPFLGKDDSENGRFLALVGIITFAEGAAWFLELSALYVNLILGLVLVNTTQAGKEIHQTLERTNRPITLVLLVFAGALWVPPDPVPTVALGVSFIALRLLGKALASRVAAANGLLRRDLFRGQLGHGDATIAMAVSFKLLFQGPAIDVAYSVIVGSVILHYLIAPRFLRALLVDGGEVRQEQET